MKHLRFVVPVALILVLVSISLLSIRRGHSSFLSDSTIVMDTIGEIKVWSVRKDCQAAIDSAFEAMARIDSLFRRGLIRMQWAGLADQPDEVRAVVELADSVYDLTSGCFDPTIGSISRLWNFVEGAKPPEAESLYAAMPLVGFDKMKEQPSREFILDVGGIAKGYAVDVASEVLESQGFHCAIINAGGDLRVLGRRTDGKLWRIGIRHPRQVGDLIGYIDVEDCAVATSGDYERFFIYQGERFHHILDPRTGMPALTCESVTVIAESAALADAFATGLFVLGPRRGLAVAESVNGIEAVFVYAEGDSIVLTSGIKGRFKHLAAN